MGWSADEGHDMSSFGFYKYHGSELRSCVKVEVDVLVHSFLIPYSSRQVAEAEKQTRETKSKQGDNKKTPTGTCHLLIVTVLPTHPHPPPLVLPANSVLACSAAPQSPLTPHPPTPSPSSSDSDWRLDHSLPTSHQLNDTPFQPGRNWAALVRATLFTGG